MRLILSIDLAYRKIEHFGVCLIEVQDGRPTKASFLSAEQLGLVPLDPRKCAKAISLYCRQQGIHVVFLDGPQGWKDPRSKLRFRRCEVEVGAPFKVGCVGEVWPKNVQSFVEFCISIFAALEAEGALRVVDHVIEPPVEGLLAIESFPTSAWRNLYIIPLPAKKRVQMADIIGRLHVLEKLFGFRAGSVPDHDELQALVAGLAGVAILSRNTDGFVAHGNPPENSETGIVEGFIVNPCLNQKAA